MDNEDKIYYQYPCKQCGCCCKNIPKIRELEVFDRGDGVCKFFEENKCSIYENRPQLCQGDYVYHSFFFDKMSVADFHTESKKWCDLLRQKEFRKQENGE